MMLNTDESIIIVLGVVNGSGPGPGKSRASPRSARGGPAGRASARAYPLAASVTRPVAWPGSKDKPNSYNSPSLAPPN